MFFARTVVEEKSVTDFIEKHQEEHRRLEDVYEAIKWRIARSPGDGFEIAGTDKRLLKTVDRPTIGIPAVVVMYSFDEETVIIEAITLSLA